MKGKLRKDPLTQALYESYRRSGKELGYWAGYFLRALKAHGGLGVAQSILAKRGKATLTKGFLNLIDQGRPDLAVEWIILLPQFRNKFSANEIRIAEERIRKNFTTPPPTEVRSSLVYPDDVPEKRNYKEGAVTRVLVNRYERDPRARKVCLKVHGKLCKVCDLLFTDVYGRLGKDFIHVHHIKPLGGIRKTYKLNPRTDLVPVCPNCHAMLHKREPPFSIHELRQLVMRNRT